MLDQLERFGLFGPGSVAWRIHAHPSGWIGAIRALLLQALEPRAMAGVVQFSRFGEDAWARFQSTSEFVMTVTYRPRQEAENAIARVRKIHDPIVGTDRYTEKPFSANDPYLLAYIHNCLVDSLSAAYLNFGGPLSRKEHDRYVQEMAVLADLIGADLSNIPLTSLELSGWLEAQPGLLITEDAKAAAETIRHMNLPKYFHPAWSVAWNASLSIMPAYAFNLYGFERDGISTFFYKQLACVGAQALATVLPSHPYFREAKFAYYDFYSTTTSANRRHCLAGLLKDLSSVADWMR